MTTSTRTSMKNKVYYDESCYVCSLEINAVRKRGEACGIEFVDISESGEYPPEYMEEMVGEFDGNSTKGIETFRIMYEKMGFKRSVAFSRLPLIRSVFNFGYYVFAHFVRPYLPKKRGTK
jgi:predicted DCC family thiol-disulfide oxidoreductase YuxK